MSEKELVDALRDLIERHAPPTHDARLVAQEIVRRDAWRLRILAGLSILFLIAGIAALTAVLFYLRSYLIVSSVTIERLAIDPAERRAIFHFERAVNGSLDISFWCLAAWVLGSVCTIWLVVSSRRATLNQINFSLMRLSEQVKDLRQASGRAAPPAQTSADP